MQKPFIFRICKSSILYLLTVFFLLAINKINCKANAMPNLTPNTFQVIQGGNQNLLNAQFLNNGLFPFIPEHLTEILESLANPINDPISISSDDVLIRPLSLTEIDDLDGINLYDESGNVISSDEIYYCTYDNGYLKGQFYCDEDGNLLYLSNDSTNTLLSVQLGGSLTTKNQWETIFADLSNQIKNDNYIFTADDVEITPQTYFYWYGETANYRPQSAHYYYCVNEYNPGVIMRMINESGQTVFYANDPSSLIYECTLGGSYDQRRITSGDFYYNSIHYNYKIVLPWDGNFTANNTYEYWVSLVGSNDLYKRIFASYGTMWNSSLAQNAHSASMFKPIQYNDDAFVPVPIDDSFSYDDLQAYINDAIESYLRNPDFDGRNALSAENYPFSYPLANGLNASNLPFPETSTNPNPVPESNPNVNPSIETPYPDIDPTTINDSIPIISGLQNKFPFSIPWDIYNLIKGLSVPRETPVLDFEITFPVINYTWNPVIDLSMYDDTAALFRTLFLIIFIIGLAVFSYNHFFGT